MKNFIAPVLSGVLAFAPMVNAAQASPEQFNTQNTPIRHVLLISIDGMHSLDFENCAKGLQTIREGESYCPNIAHLADVGIDYTNALASAPSDSFPGTAALMTGGTPRSTGMYYDVSYDRALSPPAKTTPLGIVAGNCPGDIGTQVGFDESIDADSSRLDGGGAINPDYLPRDPQRGCAPVYPHQFIRVNTIFEVVRQAGGYTAWSDKHLAYEFPNGPSGKGVNDLWSPEINSNVVPIPSVAGCSTLPDQSAIGKTWVDSFANLKCYESLKVNAIINELKGRTHNGSKAAPVPTLLGMNFQAVSVGQKLVEKAINETGGYLDSLGTPSPALLGEIEFVDASIGRFVSTLKQQGLYDSTLIIISAKHGQSPIDPKRVLRIPADDHYLLAPSDVLGGIGSGLASDGSHIVAQALEDDISLIWLRDQSQTEQAVNTLEEKENLFGGGEIFSGKSIKLMFDSPALDSRTPDIIVAPNVGIIYTGGKKKIAEHGGFSHDDRNVMLLVSNPHLEAKTFHGQVETRQIAPTILRVLGLNPARLQAVQREGTEVLPLIPVDSDDWAW